MSSLKRRLDKLEKVEPPERFVIEHYGPDEQPEEKEYPPGTPVIRIQYVNRPPEPDTH